MNSKEQLIINIDEWFCIMDNKLKEIQDAMDRLVYFRQRLGEAVEEFVNADCKRD